MEWFGESLGTGDNGKKNGLIVRVGTRRHIERWCVTGSLEGANYTTVRAPAIMATVKCTHGDGRQKHHEHQCGEADTQRTAILCPHMLHSVTMVGNIALRIK